jgi:NAD(P)-dependent dehydrogenase (short-subunit alcohol dehydrogenase family)
MSTNLGRVYAVTGAASGVGRATVERFGALDGVVLNAWLRTDRPGADGDVRQGDGRPTYALWPLA